ncbi:MAG: hypothetical protein ACQETB_01535 [Halobacteriota archaeon]
MTAAYRGVFGAIPYAFRQSSSWLFRLYVLIGTLAAVGVGLFVVFGLVVLFGETAGTPGGSLTLSRSLYVLVGLFVVGPLLAPTLFVARRHRRSRPVDDRYDGALAIAGFGFLVSLYVGLIITVQPIQQEIVTGFYAPIVLFLYALPQVAGIAPPLVAAIGIYAVHRYFSK